MDFPVFSFIFSASETPHSSEKQNIFAKTTL